MPSSGDGRGDGEDGGIGGGLSKEIDLLKDRYALAFNKIAR